MAPLQTYRVVAQGDDAVGVGLSLGDAIALLQSARTNGKKHVALVDELTGVMLDERQAKALLARH